MIRTDAIIIGGGQAGLAMSACLTARGIDHVVFERRRLGERWRSERWDSLRLLTPNWMTRLPGLAPCFDDADAYLPAADVARFLESYARSFAAPVYTDTPVTALRQAGGLFVAEAGPASREAPVAVIATGYCDVPYRPDMAHNLSPAIRQLHAATYRNPWQLPDGKVLVVGASASGLQIAHELAVAGRHVTLAVGRHIRMPRRYRGHDIMWWLDRSGILDQRAEDVADLDRARAQPSMQLSGQPNQADFDLAVVQRLGVRLAGRASAISQDRVEFAPDLAETVAAAEAKLAALLARIDFFAGSPPSSAERVAPAAVTVSGAPGAIDLVEEGFGAVIWATGYRRAYDWLRVPVTDGDGEIIHQGGVTPVAGLYALGLNFMRRRKSTYIDGVGRDAEELAGHVATHLAGHPRGGPGAKNNAPTAEFHGRNHAGEHAA